MTFPPTQQAVAAADEDDPARRHLTFNEATFKRDLALQMELDEAEQSFQDRLREKKRKFDDESRRLDMEMEERMAARNQQHNEMMQRLEADYNDQCRRHKQSLQSLFDEQRNAEQQAEAASQQAREAEVALAESQKALTKAKVQDGFAQCPWTCIPVYLNLL